MAPQSGKTTRIVALQGVVDAEAVLRVRDTVVAVLKLGRDERVVVDCRKVREMDDAVLALLAVSVQVADERVTILGLAERQLRLLRYLGLPHVSAPAGPCAAPAPMATAHAGGASTRR